MAEYSDYLQSAHWRKLKGEALQSAKGRCEACESNQRLCGHHLRYAENLTECTADDIAILCEKCHNLLHAEETMNTVLSLGRAGTIAIIRKMNGFRSMNAIEDDSRCKNKPRRNRKKVTAQQRARKFAEENKMAIERILERTREKHLEKVKCGYCRHCGPFRFCMKYSKKIKGNEALTCEHFFSEVGLPPTGIKH